MSGPVPYTLEQLQQAFGYVESSNDYGEIGPKTRKGDNAYGKYQVMDFNVPSWTEQYVGRRMTPQEFLADPPAQDAVFMGRMGQYYGQSTGTPEERVRNAGSLWFTGQNYTPETATRSDGFIDNQEYGDRILRALGAQQGARPMAMTPDPQQQQQPQGFLGRMFGGFMGAPETSKTDPFANLSRNQRMMLGFAALRDAGAALQGESSSYFNDALGGFESARDRERLRTQGQAESLFQLQQALMFAEATGDEATANLYRNLIAQTRDAMGGGAMPQTPTPAGAVPVPTPGAVPVPTPGQPMSTAEEIAVLDQQIAEADAATTQLTRDAKTGGITGLDYGPQIEQSRIEAERMRQRRAELVRLQGEAAREVEGAERLTIPLIDRSLDFLIAGFDPVTGDPIINPTLVTPAGRFVEKSLQSPEYQQFVGAITTLKTGTLLEALGEVSVGALSDGERAALESMKGDLNPSNPLGSVETLREMRRIAQAAVDRARGSGGGTTTSTTVTWD